MPRLYHAPAPATFASYTVASFIDTLTQAEAVALITTSKTDSVLEVWMELAKARGGIDFNDTKTREAAPYLVAVGVVTEERLAALIGG